MIVIIDYGIGNLASVKNALQFLDVHCKITDDISTIQKAKSLILPGVGAASYGMDQLKKRGLDKVIIEEVKKEKPLLGICLGMQLLFSESEEGNVPCLNVIEGRVLKFNSSLKIPQIGWNQISKKNESKLLAGIANNSYFYFVNSYYCSPTKNKTVAGTTNYGNDFCSIVTNNNVYGVQFHPERSGTVGLTLLKNFSLL